MCVLYFLKSSDNFRISISCREEPGFQPSPLPSTAITMSHIHTRKKNCWGKYFSNNIICHQKTDDTAKNYLILWKEQWKPRKINWPQAFRAHREFDHLNFDVPNRKEKIISNSRSQIQNLIEDSPYVNLGPISYAYRVRVTWKQGWLLSSSASQGLPCNGAEQRGKWSGQFTVIIENIVFLDADKTTKLG